MNNLAQIIQAIATAVTAKMSYTISQRIADLATQLSTPSSGTKWIDRSGFGEDTVAKRRLEFSQKQVTAAEDRQTELQKLHDNATDPAEKSDYAARLKAVAISLEVVAASHKKLVDEINRERQARNAPGSPNGSGATPIEHKHVEKVERTRLEQLVRYARVKFRQAIGSKPRQFLNSMKSQAVATRLSQARATFRAAKTAHAVGKNPATRKALFKAGAALAASRGMSGVVAGLSRLGAVAGPIGAAIAIAATVVSTSLVLINRQLDIGRREVERFRAERSRFSAQVANAVTRYDLQSMQIEQRASQATGGSAAGVVRSTMALRESVEPRQQAWEDIGNKVLAATLDVATNVSDVFNAIDVITPSISAIVGLAHDIGVKLGILREIEKNTSKTTQGDVRVLELGMRGNREGAPNKRQNNPLPPIR